MMLMLGTFKEVEERTCVVGGKAAVESNLSRVQTRVEDDWRVCDVEMGEGAEVVEWITEVWGRGIYSE
jgi:predicted RNA-binding protein YlxR (DUF448 family)